MNRWQLAATLRAAAAGAQDRAFRERGAGNVSMYHYWRGVAGGKEEAAALVERTEVEA